MYRAQIGARAADGVRECGSLDSYIADFRACSKAFEMYVADRLSAERNSTFVVWEDLDASTKEARGLTKADSGVDVTDGSTTLVQCKLRARYVTWRECATFFASAVSFADGAYSVPWQSLVLARNACSTLSRTLAELGASRPFDTPIPLSAFRTYAHECLAAHNAPLTHAARVAPVAPRFRDYQIEAINLCVKDTPRAAYVTLPTGCGKSLVMAHVAARVDLRVVILVPLVVLLEQMLDVLAEFGRAVAAVGGGLTTTSADIDAACVVVCVYNSAHKIDLASFDRVLIDEAHFVRAPAIYSDLTDSDEPEENEESDGAASDEKRGYAAVRAATTLASARLFSATLDVPDGAEKCTRSIREMISAGYLCDYTLDVPVFAAGAGNADLARHLVRAYRSIIVFCATRADGVSFCAAMNAHGPCARYIDCDTPRRERCETIATFKTGELAFIVNVRVLSVGFDAPITRGVCFVNMPASKTHIVQVIGRCLRIHADKRIARVILPLVAGTHDEDKRARDFMRVLAQSDSRLAQAMRAGGGGYIAVSRVDDEDVEASEQTTEVLYTAVYDSMGGAAYGSSEIWSARYDELVAFYDANGTLPPPSTPGGLGLWVRNQRHSRAKMSTERKARLDALEWWVWSLRDAPIRADWDARFDEIVAYQAEHGVTPPQSVGTLGAWVQHQRAHRDSIPADRKARLEALEWWSWDPRDEAWESKYAALVAYYAEAGPGARTPTTSGPHAALGKWIAKQRSKRHTMGAERVARLESNAWWVWDARCASWESSYAALVEHHAAHGTVPTAPSSSRRRAPAQGRTRATGVAAIGNWVTTQRGLRETMSAERRARLESLGFWEWDPFEAAWESNYAALVRFYEEHGTVPWSKSKVEGTSAAVAALGTWVEHQRAQGRRGALDAERRARLDALPYWSWDHRRVSWWESNYAALVAYHAEHRRMPSGRGDNPNLAHWVQTQRARRAVMSEERRNRLDALEFWWWTEERD